MERVKARGRYQTVEFDGRTIRIHGNGFSGLGAFTREYTVEDLFSVGITGNEFYLSPQKGWRRVTVEFDAPGEFKKLESLIKRAIEHQRWQERQDRKDLAQKLRELDREYRRHPAAPPQAVPPPAPSAPPRRRRGRWKYAAALLLVLTAAAVLEDARQPAENPDRPAQAEVNAPADSVSGLSLEEGPVALPPAETAAVGAPSEEEIRDQLAEIAAAEAERERRDFMLCIAQNDVEVYLYGGTCQYPALWQEVFTDNFGDGYLIMQDIKNDLDLYLTLGESEYQPVWLYGDLIYEMYQSGELQRSLPAEQYEELVGMLENVSRRLGVLPAAPGIGS